MKIKRQKKVGRILAFFKNNYGHRPPFQVLLDGTFTAACLQVILFSLFHQNICRRMFFAVLELKWLKNSKNLIAMLKISIA